MDIQNKKAKSRNQNKKDNELVFNYETGNIENRTIHEEVQETRELWTQ